MSRITLDQIKITGLFGPEGFNYDLDLRNGEDISILIAPNGCGKTTIFSIVTFMFKPTIKGYKKVSLVPFTECKCTLSNGKEVVLSAKQKKSTVVERVAFYSAMMMSNEEYESIANIRNDISLSIDGEKIAFSKEFESLLNHTDPEFLMLWEEMDFSDWDVNRSIPGGFRKEFENFERFISSIQDKYRAHDCCLSINFITADRLHSGNGNSRPDRMRLRRMGYDLPIGVDNPIIKAQKNTQRLYEKIKDEYTTMQSKVKDSLPKQYLGVTEPLWDYDEFEQRWKKYVADIEKYYELGLLDSAKTILDVKKLKKYYEEKGTFLTVYLAAFAETLKPLEEHYEKFKLFADIFNERNRITKKTISYGKKGIVLKVGKSELSLEHLSSGEKNDFVMFYDLIFNSDDNGLVLIDEPEISLHIEWQQTFLDSLIEICKMNGLQSIVATHSPNIIHGHRELFAERGIEHGSEED